MRSVEPRSGFLTMGQATAQTIARRAAASGRLATTLLVQGPAGAGKSAFVDDLLALLFCTADDPVARPCNACRGCHDARARAHPDLVVGSVERWREMRGTGESIVGAARRWLLESAGAPVVAERRVVVVEGVDRAGEETQNALLKALEEPGPRQLFILTAADPARVLPTIRSRAQPLRIGSVPADELVQRLVDDERIPADQAEAIARIADGLAGSALRLVRDPARLDWRRRTQGELLDLLTRGRADRFAAADELVDAYLRLPQEGTGVASSEAVEDDGLSVMPVAPSRQREAATAIVDAWLGLARDLLLAGAGRAALTPSEVLLPGLRESGAGIGSSQLTAMVALLERIRDGLTQNAAPRLALQTAMLAWPQLRPT